MTTIFLAGAEVERLTRALLDNGCKNILYSFYFILTMRREQFVSRMQEQYPDVNWMLDSGAFSYWAQMKSGREQMDWHRFKKLYFEYVQGTWTKWQQIAELDLDMAGIVEPWAVEKWRDQMFDMCPGAPVMPVWHAWRGTSWWTDYCKDPRIKVLGIGSDGNREAGVARRLVMEAHRHGKPVHGFGMTEAALMQIIPFDTVDSTSWLTGQKFGTIYTFQNNVFKAYAKRDLVNMGRVKVPPNLEPKEGDEVEDVLLKQALVMRIERENANRGRLVDRYAENKKQMDRRKLRSYFKKIGCDPQLIFDEVKLARAKGEGKDDEYRKACIAEVRKANVRAWVALSNRLEMVRRAQGRRARDANFRGMPSDPIGT